MCGVRGRVARVRRVAMTGVSVTGVTRVSAVCSVTAVSELAESSHRHRGETSAAESEAEAIEIHIPNTTCSRVGW